MNYLEKFNQTFQEFVEDLCVAYPNDGEFRVCKMVLNTALMADKTFLQRFFHNKIVCVYLDEIANKNESFFMDKDYTKYAQKFSGADQLIAKLKSCWSNMTEENKEVVWRYLKVLTALSQKVHTRT